MSVLSEEAQEQQQEGITGEPANQPPANQVAHEDEHTKMIILWEFRIHYLFNS